LGLFNGFEDGLLEIQSQKNQNRQALPPSHESQANLAGCPDACGARALLPA
jgi:hypothetical protein